MFQVSRVTRVHKSTLSIINRSFVKVGDKVPVNYLKGLFSSKRHFGGCLLSSEYHITVSI